MSQKSFTTANIARLVGVAPNQIRAWQGRGLLFGEKLGRNWFFDFQDLVAAKATKKLLDRGLALAQVTRALQELRASNDETANPLVRCQLDGSNGHVVMNLGCHLIDVSTGQLHLDVYSSDDHGGRLLGDAHNFGRNTKDQPPSLESFLASAIAAEISEDWQAAAQAYRGVIRFDPKDVTAIVNLGNCHFRLGEFSVATEVYRAALQVESDCHEAWYNLANVLDETQQFDEAISAFKTALALAPNRFEVHYNLALTFEKVGSRDAARQHWQSVLELSDDEEARRMATLFLESYSALDL